MSTVYRFNNIQVAVVAAEEEARAREADAVAAENEAKAREEAAIAAENEAKAREADAVASAEKVRPPTLTFSACPWPYFRVTLTASFRRVHVKLRLGKPKHPLR